MPFRFVHTADIHLDSPLRSLSMRNPDLASLIGDATRQVLTSIVDLCLEERVDALIVAGDLYDGDQTSMKTARFLADEMGRLHEAGIEVYKVRGNHDARSRITRELQLPPSIKVFGDRPDGVLREGSGPNIAIHGISFAKPTAPDSLLPSFGAPTPDAFNIGVMHTSLGGAIGHDVYAPCSLADLRSTGFRYWALGHIHQRAEHAGSVTVVMPGIPQGRDIGEAGPKSVTLVTIGDDGAIRVDERPTGIAQFERVAVDLSGTTDWYDAVAAIGRSIAEARRAARAEHLVTRVSLTGTTPLSWRLRREADVILAETERWGERIGKVWIEKVGVDTRDAPARATIGSADPVAELGQLMAGGLAGGQGLREAIGRLVEEICADLPHEVRGLAGGDGAAFEAFVDELIEEGGRDVLASLAAAKREDA